MPELPGFSVYVDGSRHPLHASPGEGISGARIRLVMATGEVAEVQVAKVGTELNVVMAGDVAPFVDQRGFQAARIAPTAKEGANA